MHYIYLKWLLLMALFPLVRAKPSQLTGSRKVRDVVVPYLPPQISERVIPSEEPDFDDDWRLNDTLSYEKLRIGEEDPDLQAALNRYTVHTHALRWFDAVAECWREGGRLATPGDAIEAKQLGQLVALLADANITNTEIRDYMFVGIHNFGMGQNLLTVEGGETFKVSVGGRVFRAHLSPQPWALAAAACSGGGVGGAGRLALPDGGRREGLLAGLLAERVFSRAEELFVDANDVVQEGAWKDGKGFNVDGNLNWVPNHPRRNRSTNCAAMISTGQLVDVTCSASRPFLCEVDSLANAALERPAYLTVAGLGRYALHLSGRTWLSAASRCHAEGATLALPRSKEEAEALEAMRRAVEDTHPDLPSYGLLVGAYSVLTPNKWRTLEGEVLQKSEFNEWFGMNGNYLNQPYYCGGLWLGKYINLGCNEHHMYICKKPL